MSKGTAVLPVNIVNGTERELIAFLVLNIWTSHLGLPILLAVVTLSKSVKRHPTFLNLCIVFIFIGFSSSLLLYSGHLKGPEPPKMLCLFQASLLYGMPAMSSTAVFALVYQMFSVIRATFRGEEISREENFFRLWIMMSAPYLAWFTCIIATAAVGAAHPDKISRNRRYFYCSVENSTLTNTLTVTAAIILLATLVLEGWTLVLFYKRWVKARRGSQAKSFEINLPLRVLGFGLYLMIAMSLSLLSIKSPESPIPDLVIASAPTCIILIFGTQPDILKALCFWRKPPPQPLARAAAKRVSISWESRSSVA